MPGLCFGSQLKPHFHFVAGTAGLKPWHSVGRGGAESDSERKKALGRAVASCCSGYFIMRRLKELSARPMNLEAGVPGRGGSCGGDRLVALRCGRAFGRAESSFGRGRCPG
jgi:hypothetical protein